MKKSKKVALCGVLSALAVVILLAAYFPYLTFALPAIAGGLFMIPMVEMNAKWAFSAYGASAVLAAILFPQLESTWWFVGFFGYYPVMKSFLEKPKSRLLEYVFKFLLFNASIVLVYLLVLALGMPLEGLELFGNYTIHVLVLLANAMFVVYDIALSRVYYEYMRKLHTRITRLLK